MNEKEIIEGNKLIADFMGKKKTTGFGLHLKFDTWYGGILLSDLKYHTSWDWLMPVVEKIEIGLKWAYSVKIEHEVYNKGRYTCEIYDAGYATKIEWFGKSKIETVWQAVVAFIKLYNFNNK